jgi:hypothetical protein
VAATFCARFCACLWLLACAVICGAAPPACAAPPEIVSTLKCEMLTQLKNPKFVPHARDAG